MRYADWLSLARIPVSGVIAGAAIKLHWSLAFWLIIVALLTDLLDGAVARRWSGPTKLGNNLDDLADLAFGVGITAGLLFSGHLSWLTVAVMLAIYVPLAVFFEQPVATRLRKWGKRGMMIYYPSLIIIAIVWFAWLAFGNVAASIVALTEFIALVALGYHKRQRLIADWRGDRCR